MKTMVYVFGCGRFFENKQADILAKYDIGAILDNNKKGKIQLLNGKSVPVLKPAEAVEVGDVPIIIMVYDFYSVWRELQGLSIDPSRIIFPNIFLPFTDEEQMISIDGGEFRIVEDDIYYVNEHKRYIIDSTDAIHILSMRLEKEHVDASFITDLAPTEPLNRKFGLSRGTPIDRYYIEAWLEKNKELIRGDVLEIAEDTYTKRFGGSDVIPHILHVSLEQEGIIKGDFETGEGITEDSMDCIILTQTLPFIYGCDKVIANIYKMLRKGGTALITAGGISQISRYDMDRWGHFWSFTTASLKRLIEESAFGENYEITVYGNVKVACALLYGMAAEELKTEELEYADEDYPVSICVIVTK
ncbi:MAG: hypothetical protein K2J95_05720 [Lachnospiraceae bacterium]|nr:hypothetical protein [Lachnospiraceae bacterium]